MYVCLPLLPVQAVQAHDEQRAHAAAAVPARPGLPQGTVGGLQGDAAAVFQAVQGALGCCALCLQGSNDNLACGCTCQAWTSSRYGKGGGCKGMLLTLQGC
jgi:hypothetical protein